MSVFVSTLILALSLILIAFNWSRLKNSFKDSVPDAPIETSEQAPEPSEPMEEPVRGFELGNQAMIQLDALQSDRFFKNVNSFAPTGFQLGIDATLALNEGQKSIESKRESAFMSSVQLTNDLLNGQHLSDGQNESSGILQKSLLATHYLGETTVMIDSALQNDSAMLSKINNALAVEIFPYLNQADDRADSLDNYVTLLKNLKSTAETRSLELQSTIGFLEGNYEAQERSITILEEQFFVNLESFEGGTADENLQEFIAIGQQQTEVRAKIGAYQVIKDYYDLFIPYLDNMIASIEANRDPLIAGVKVVEIENMVLPLIIREE